jgi:hypothetical protein
VLVLFVGFRSRSPDYDNYAVWFDWVSAGHLLAEDWAKDPAFVLISFIVSMLGIGLVGVTLAFAIAALASQFVLSRIVSDRKWITLFFYLVVCRTLVGSDMASIRSGVAIPLMSISIVFAFRGKRKIALLLYIVALAFHLSVLIGLVPFVLAMSKVRFTSRGWIVCVALVTVFIKAVLGNLLVLLSLFSRLTPYTGNLVESHAPPSAYYVYIVARILLLALIAMFCWDALTAENRMMLFCYSIGICLQIIFIFNNALSWRSSDIFGMFDIAVLMIPLKLMKGYYRLSYAVGLVAFGLALFQYSLNVMEPYRWIFA